MPQDGKFADRDHWLRNIVGDIPDPCSVAAAQNHCFHILNTNLVETDYGKPVLILPRFRWRRFMSAAG